MATDFETALTQLLHDATPEPPAGLAPPTVATLASPSNDADVLPLAGDHVTPRRTPRWAPLAAAAAVAALAGGIGLAVATSGPSTPPAAHSSPPPTDRPTTARTVPPCRSAALVLSAGGLLLNLARDSGTGAITSQERNVADRECTVALPSVSVGLDLPHNPSGTKVAGPQGAPRSLTLPSHGRLVITVRLRVSGQCRSAGLRGWDVSIGQSGYGYTFPMHVTGCSVVPTGWTYRIAR
jgi:hypothetical protein